MGNTSSKDHRPSSRHEGRHSGHQQPLGSPQPVPPLSPQDQQRLAQHIYSGQRSGPRRVSQQNLSLFHLNRSERETESGTPERPRETKPEREARRAERDRQTRLRERERSMREESVDGGYLVTLGTYTGTEDFSKPIVRQLQIERRLAPFWRGLNDHSSEWTEAQLVAVARGLPLPAPDEVPPELERPASQASSNQHVSETHSGGLAVPMPLRSSSHQSDASANLSASHPAFSTSGPSSPTSPPIFRGRAKTLASLAGGSKSQSPDLTPQEIHLPTDPYVNGTPVEAVLYKDATECPICFLSYPPYLNHTRCCNQDICSECFVQIKRPDPHPPEHEQPGQSRPAAEEAETLVSEVASCPFCKTPEFGVTYDPPSFRRGLAYVNQHALRNPASALSSSSSASSLASGTGRRRATSLSAHAPNVITTDRVRPDWAKKLSDARANALRRSAAATALHNAAYMLGSTEGGSRIGGLRLSRRRTLFTETSPGASGSVTPREGIGEFGTDTFPGRLSSRRSPRVEDLEELMMNEAIRQSLAAEEERQRQAAKEATKEAKKKARETKREERRADKQRQTAPRTGSAGSASLYHIGSNESSSTWGSQSMARSSSNLGNTPSATAPLQQPQHQPQHQHQHQHQHQQQGPAIPEELAQSTSKGKQPAHDTTLTAYDHRSANNSAHTTSSSASDDAQRHLTASRATLQLSPSAPLPMPSAVTTTATPSRIPVHDRQLSAGGSSADSLSFVESNRATAKNGSGLDVPSNMHQHPPPPSFSGTPSTTAAASGPSQLESPFNFRSLAAMIDHDEIPGGEADPHIDHTIPLPQELPSSQQQGQGPSRSFPAEDELKEPSPNASPVVLAHNSGGLGEIRARRRGDSGESSASSTASPLFVDAQNASEEWGDGLVVASAPSPLLPHHHESRVAPGSDRKGLGNVRVMQDGHDTREAMP